LEIKNLNSQISITPYRYENKCIYFIIFIDKVLWHSSAFYSANSILDNKTNVDRFAIVLILDLSYNGINKYYILSCALGVFLTHSRSSTGLSIKLNYLFDYSEHLMHFVFHKDNFNKSKKTHIVLPSVHLVYYTISIKLLFRRK
jgi:hypothetical protein